MRYLPWWLFKLWNRWRRGIKHYEVSGFGSMAKGGRPAKPDEMADAWPTYGDKKAVDVPPYDPSAYLDNKGL